MKQLFTLAAFVVALNAGAQCTLTSYLQDSTATQDWIDAAFSTDGGLVGLVEPMDVFGDILGIKINADRSLAWSKRYMTSDPQVLLDPVQVVATPGGGMVLMGYRVAPGHHNV